MKYDILNPPCEYYLAGCGFDSCVAECENDTILEIVNVLKRYSFRHVAILHAVSSYLKSRCSGRLIIQGEKAFFLDNDDILSEDDYKQVTGLLHYSIDSEKVLEIA